MTRFFETLARRTMPKERTLRRGNVVSIRLEITNKQDIYTDEDVISGEVILDFKSSATIVRWLGVSLDCVEQRSIGEGSIGATRQCCSSHQFVVEPTTMGAGRHRFAFTLCTPQKGVDFPPTIGNGRGARENYGVYWSLEAGLYATGEDCYASTESQHISRSCSLPVNIYPTWRMDQGIEPEESWSSEITETKRLKITLSCPNQIEQLPELCDIRVKIEAHKPVYVKSIDVYLERIIFIWFRDLRSKVHKARVPLGRVVLEQPLTTTLELDGLKLGWSIKSRQPGTYVYWEGCLSYRLCVKVHVRRRPRVIAYRDGVNVSPPQRSDALHRLPAYNEHIGAKDTDRSSPQ